MPQSVLLIITAGLAAGAVHVWTGPDHMAALLPLSFGKRLRAAWLGARWGVGHSTGVAMVAMSAVTLRQYLDVHIVSTGAERLVGVMLIGLGAWGIRRALRMNLHAHTHTHDGEPHAHVHVHTTDSHEPPVAQAVVLTAPEHDHVHAHAAFFAGTLHGLAGASHFLAVLPALALPGWNAPVSYLGAFGIGTIGAMAIFAGVVGMSSAWVGERRGMQLARRLCAIAGGLTIAVGIAWLVVPLMGVELP